MIPNLRAKTLQVFQIFHREESNSFRTREDPRKKALRLLLNCKTRWNSFVPMIKRLLRLKLCIKQALIDFGTLDMMYYDEKSFEFLEKILEILKPLELGVKELSKKPRSNTFNKRRCFQIRKLRTLDTDLSQEILVALKQRFSERRNEDIVSLMKNLQGSNISRDKSYEDFSYSTKPAAILLAKDLIKRLFSSPINNDSSATISDFLESTPNTSSVAMELQISIESLSFVRPTTRPDTFTELQKEFKL
jgi:hypothetical protein